MYNGIVHNKIGDFMRRIRRKKEKQKKKIIIISTFLFLIIMTSGYAAFSTNITLHAKGNIKEPSRVIQSWDENSQTDFHSDYYKQNIVSITFLDNNNVPDNAAESWDVSEDGKGGVKAWIVPNSEDNTKYDLYIGAKDGVIANEDSGYLFYNFRELKEINFNNNYDTSNAKDMSFMFRCCANLESIDLSTLDTSNVTSMYGMFSMWDSSIGKYISSKLSMINFGSNFDTSNVTNMRGMFAGLTELKELDVSNFNTSNVTTMYHMFDTCRSLTTLDVSNFNTSKVTDMNQMFGSLSSIKKLNLCSFDTSKVTDMSYMFGYTYNLERVYVGTGWNTNNVTNNTGMWESSNISQVTTGMC